MIVQVTSLCRVEAPIINPSRDYEPNLEKDKAVQIYLV